MILVHVCHEDPLIQARNIIAKRVLLGFSLDRAALVAIGHRFGVDAYALAAGMLLRNAFDPHRPVIEA